MKSLIKFNLAVETVAVHLSPVDEVTSETLMKMAQTETEEKISEKIYNNPNPPSYASHHSQNPFYGKNLHGGFMTEERYAELNSGETGPTSYQHQNYNPRDTEPTKYERLGPHRKVPKYHGLIRGEKNTPINNQYGVGGPENNQYGVGGPEGKKRPEDDPKFKYHGLNKSRPNGLLPRPPKNVQNAVMPAPNPYNPHIKTNVTIHTPHKEVSNSTSYLDPVIKNQMITKPYNNRHYPQNQVNNYAGNNRHYQNNPVIHTPHKVVSNSTSHLDSYIKNQMATNPAQFVHKAQIVAPVNSYNYRYEDVSKNYPGPEDENDAVLKEYEELSKKYFGVAADPAFRAGKPHPPVGALPEEPIHDFKNFTVPDADDGIYRKNMSPFKIGHDPRSESDYWTKEGYNVPPAPNAYDKNRMWHKKEAIIIKNATNPLAVDDIDNATSIVSWAWEMFGKIPAIIPTSIQATQYEKDWLSGLYTKENKPVYDPNNDYNLKVRETPAVGDYDVHRWSPGSCNTWELNGYGRKPQRVAVTIPIGDKYQCWEQCGKMPLIDSNSEPKYACEFTQYPKEGYKCSAIYGHFSPSQSYSSYDGGECYVLGTETSDIDCLHVTSYSKINCLKGQKCGDPCALKSGQDTLSTDWGYCSKDLQCLNFHQYACHELCLRPNWYEKWYQRLDSQLNKQFDHYWNELNMGSLSKYKKRWDELFTPFDVIGDVSSATSPSIITPIQPSTAVSTPVVPPTVYGGPNGQSGPKPPGTGGYGGPTPPGGNGPQYPGGHGPQAPTPAPGGHGPPAPGGTGPQYPGGHGPQAPTPGPGGHGPPAPGGTGPQAPGGNGPQYPGGHGPQAPTPGPGGHGPPAPGGTGPQAPTPGPGGHGGSPTPSGNGGPGGPPTPTPGPGGHGPPAPAPGGTGPPAPTPSGTGGPPTPAPGR